RLFAPLVPGYREQAQTWASEALGRPVHISSMGATWGLFGPELMLENVGLLSQDQQHVVITVREIRLGVTPSALIHAQFSHPSRIILIQPQLTLERETNGSFSVLGLEGSLDMSREHMDWRQTVASAFAQDMELLIRRGKVTVIDRHTNAARLVFSDVRLNLDNSADTHRISGRMQMPPPLGRSLSFAGQIRGLGTKPDTWQWQGDVQATALNVPQLLFYWPAYSGRFSSGTLDLDTSVSGVGTAINNFQADVDAQQLIPAAGSSARNGFTLLAGQLNWKRSADGWLLAGSNLELQHDQESWPSSSFTVQSTKGKAGSISWSGNVGFLRFQDMVTLAAWLPADISPDRQRLLRLSPSGDVSKVDFRAHWNGKALDTWVLAGRFNQLGLRADGNIPGFSGLSGTLSANQNAGGLQLASRNASVTFPHLFRGPLDFTALNTNVHFNHDAQGWHFSISDFSATNPDIQQATAQGSLLLPADGSSPVIDLQAKAQNVTTRNKSVYLPVGIMPKEVVSWLDSAIAGGTVPSANLELRGRLQDFPYDKGNGLFDIRFHLINGILDYAAGWPRVQGLEADVEFKNQGMSAVVQHGTLLGDDVSGATARFADLRQGILVIKGTARGSAAIALDFLRKGPLKESFGTSLDSLTTTGRCDVDLNLVLPVENVETYTLDGRVRLREVNLGVASLPKLQLSRLRGDVKIGSNGVSSDSLQGLLLGKPVTIRLRPDKERTQVTVEGGVDASVLSAVLPGPFQKVLSGATSWQLSGQIPDQPVANPQQLSLTLTSDLQGLGIDLPAPFAKTVASTAPLRVSLGFTGDKRLEVQARYVDTLNGESLFMDESGSWRFDRGEVVFGGGQPSLPADTGLMLIGKLAEFSVDGWKVYSVESGSSGGDFIPPFLLGVDLQIARFSGFGQTIDDLHVQLARETNAWTVQLISDAIAGKIILPYKVDNVHPITADMQRVTWIHKSTTLKAHKNTAEFKPDDVPPMHITVEHLRVNDLKLDNVQAQLEQVQDGVTLKSFSITNPAFSLTSNGTWIQQTDGTQQSTLNMQMKSSDVGKTLQAFGYAPGIDAKQAEFQANFSWPDSPFANIPPILNGKIHIQLKEGRLLEVQPGAGRLFGLLSINALPRRLLLNFSDVFGKGFAFDSIGGDFKVEHGDAYTTNMVVSAPAAEIHMVGRIGLAKHDFDEALIVDPSVGATLPVIGAIAAGSLGVGAVLYALTEIFKKPLSAVGKERYHLTGTWDNPILTKMNGSKPAAPTPH
ncbi:MAG: YhdP family protein, partial [Gammaproteobacteria bacterium]